MDAPVVLSKTVAPVCLPPASTDPDQYVDQDAIILGWGGGNERSQIISFVYDITRLFFFF